MSSNNDNGAQKNTLSANVVPHLLKSLTKCAEYARIFSDIDNNNDKNYEHEKFSLIK